VVSAAGVIGATLVPGAVRSERIEPSTSRPSSFDVIVVGAGLAGLAAARRAVREGATVLVLEARSRVGGRTLNASLGGSKVVEVGGQWVGPGQTSVLALAEAVGVETFKTYNTGSNLLYYQGRLAPYESAGVPPIPDADTSEFLSFGFGVVDPLAAKIPLETPWTAEGVDTLALDGQTVESWKLAQLATPGARFLFDLVIEAVFACEPRDVSLLEFLFSVHSSGGFLPLVSVDGGAQDSRLVGGSQRISERVAAELGERIVLNAPVERIRQHRSFVTVEAAGRSYRGEHVIVTLPPALCPRIEFDPPLPGLRDQLTQRFPQGSVIKCQAAYDTPFWRAAGLTGQVTSDTGPVKVTFDNSPPDGDPGVLVGFIEGDEARVWGQRPAADRRRAVIESFARYFGSRAGDARQYIEYDWSEDQWTRGCYGGYLPPGVLTSYGPALRAPVGRIHWAGAETAGAWNGYMDGAVSSGERAFDEVKNA
jgi:monoamine oxidase